MVMRISENQKNGFSMTLFNYGSIYFDYGDIRTLYQNGLLENGWYYLTNGKTRVTYGIAYAGQKDGERVYTLDSLYVEKSAGKNNWEEYTKSQWLWIIIILLGICLYLGKTGVIRRHKATGTYRVSQLQTLEKWDIAAAVSFSYEEPGNACQSEKESEKQNIDRPCPDACSCQYTGNSC